jgi:hypothetical protein
MSIRVILAAALAAGTATAALSEVQVKTPNAAVEAPAGGVDVNVDLATKLTPTDAWVGRPVYSSDGEHVGEVSVIAGNHIYADIGGFLGLGETRVMLAPDQIARVDDERIDLTITQQQANNLPAAEAQPDAGEPN